jgi:hypothetical protein
MSQVVQHSRTSLTSLKTPAAELFTAAGIFEGPSEAPRYLQLFVRQAEQVLEKVRGLVQDGEMSEDQAEIFQQLLVEACRRILCHGIIASNHYLARFAQGVTLAQARHELQQFSVFAAQFNAAQAQLVANAPTLEAYQERLKLLLNEEGIPYREGFEGELTGKWNMQTVHFTWLRNMGRGLGLEFEDLAKVWLAKPGTKAFVDAVFKYYASTNPNTALGASFAIENWAANYLWEPWIAGMQKLNATLDRPVDLGYLTYHEAEERHHSQATLDELLENFRQPFFDGEAFLDAGEAILTEGVQAYYESQLATLPEKDDTWPKQACGTH